MSKATKPEKAPPAPPPRIERKQIRHDYTPADLASLGGELSRAIAAQRQVEIEAKEVKSSFATRLAEAMARVDRLSTSIMNGWDMREKSLRVVFYPKERKKRYFLEDSKDDTNPVLVEEMTSEDYQIDLSLAESVFEARSEVKIFPDAEGSFGVLVVGRLNGRWYAALRIRVGDKKLDERLNPEGKATRQRWDAVSQAAARAQAWLEECFGKETAKGFEGPIAKALDAQKEREE